jgi:hypothetical protein
VIVFHEKLYYNICEQRVGNDNEKKKARREKEWEREEYGCGKHRLIIINKLFDYYSVSPFSHYCLVDGTVGALFHPLSSLPFFIFCCKKIKTKWLFCYFASFLFIPRFLFETYMNSARRVKQLWKYKAWQEKKYKKYNVLLLFPSWFFVLFWYESRLTRLLLYSSFS